MMETVKEYLKRMWRARTCRSKRPVAPERSRATCGIKIKIKVKNRCLQFLCNNLRRPSLLKVCCPPLYLCLLEEKLASYRACDIHTRLPQGSQGSIDLRGPNNNKDGSVRFRNFR
ncbi:hypothetical protein E2C01_079033 [Portunus trituberculatus]|uniref:Uncharacterized protein n=1 Tax=Portunus trituberculatus TaxID=210409 RepID=A0A5B7IRP6_PORTR|nr:hypothetical protein [Portunus trituberculatus]